MEDSGRPLTAKEKRQEQLRRWENSATDSESPLIINLKPKVKFDDGAVFLAACSSGDLTEVGKLLNKGADINFANVDGLTALHQACIDGNLDVVEYLVQRNIDIDQEDNEGWTPLHAAASCGYMDITRYLVKHGANVAAVNSEGEVPLDIAEEDDMIDFLEQEIKTQGLDLDAARNQEREVMVTDAKQYHNALLNGEKPPLYRHPKSGATSLHVAAAKGYVEVIKVLLQAGVNPNVQDNDGWTPLHAASHWSQKESAKLLADKNADFSLRNKLGQAPSDVADEDMLDYLETLQEQQEENKLNTKEDPVIDDPPSPTKKGSNLISNSSDLKDSSSRLNHPGDQSSSSEEEDDAEDSTSSSDLSNWKSIKPIGVDKQANKKLDNNVDHTRPPLGLSRIGSDAAQTKQNTDNSQTVSGSNSFSSPGFRRNTRPASLHFPTSTNQKDIRPQIMSANSVTGNRPIATTQPIQKSEVPGTPTERNADIKEGAPDTWRSGLRKTGSFDEKKRGGNPRMNIGNRNQGEATGIITSKSTDNFATKKTDIRTARVAPILDKSSNKSKEMESSYQRSSSYNRSGDYVAPTFKRSEEQNEDATSTTNNSEATNNDLKTDKLDRRRSHLQPVRDEEAEAQRKARSRRERQSRRSTQGVTLDVYEEAKRQIESMKQERETSSGSSSNKTGESKEGTNETFKIPHNDSISMGLNRRHKDLHHPSGSVSSSTASATSNSSSSPVVTLPSGYIPMGQRVKQSSSSSVPTISLNDDLDRNNLDYDIDDDIKDTQTPAGQSPSAKKSAAQQRRRQRKERRSTGLPNLKADSSLIDMMEVHHQEKNPPSDEDDEVLRNEVSSSDQLKTERLKTTSSRYETSSLPDRHNRHRSGGLRGSDSDLPSRFSSSVNNTNSEGRSTDEKNYKKLYDDQCTENENLRSELAEARRKIADLESRLERAEDLTAKRKAIEVERKERKVLERKLADMEKELMNKDDHSELHAKNLELKQENQALTRLVDKLSKPTPRSQSMVQAFANRQDPTTQSSDKLSRQSVVKSLPEETESSESESSLDVADRKSSSLERVEEKRKEVETSEELPERRSSFTETPRYSSSVSSRSPSGDYSSYKDYKSDYPSSRYTSSSRSSSSYSSDKSYHNRGGSLRDKDSSLHSSRLAHASSSPSLSSRYNTIPVPSSRSRFSNLSATSGSSQSYSRNKDLTDSTLSSRFSDRNKDLSSSGSYRSRNYDQMSRSRSPVAFPTSANSKRVGNLMNTYRLKP